MQYPDDAARTAPEGDADNDADRQVDDIAAR